MQPRQVWMWLLDDWTLAVNRSLVKTLPYQAQGALRVQWRVGQAVKTGLLVLPLLVLCSFLVPHTPLVRWLLQGWTALELLLVAVHLFVGVRHHVSFGWALHHLRPLVLTGTAAFHDLRQKAFLAGGLGVLLFATLLPLSYP